MADLLVTFVMTDGGLEAALETSLSGKKKTSVRNGIVK